MTDLKSDDAPSKPSVRDLGLEADAAARATALETDAPAPSEGDGDDDVTNATASPASTPSEADATSTVDAVTGIAKEAQPEVPLIPRGNPLRWARGGVTAAVGAGLAFLLMAHSGQLRVGVPLGLVFVMIAAWGVMDLLGTFDDGDERLASRTTLAAIAPPLAGTVGTFVLFAASLGGAATGLLPNAFWAVLVTLTFVAFVAAIYRLGTALGPWATDELGVARPLWKREGFWIVAAAGALYFPCLGSYSLWDPWETHYGEVAREILARDDWISLWWAQDGWFWSKPILNFWIQALAMASLGVHYKADMMLQGAGGAIARPEWVVRAPNVLLTIVAMYLIYKGVARVFGRRAGLLGGLVLATMPDWYFLAHQTMTDMPCVAPLTATMGLLLLGLHTDEDQKTKAYELKVGKASFRLTGWHLTFGVILICAIPQILYLLSRNLELILSGHGPHGFRVHWDEFRNGSAGNCGLPGNEACVAQVPASLPKTMSSAGEGLIYGLKRYFASFEPSLQALSWSAALGMLLYMSWGERRLRRLYYLAAWFFAAIATMGKGPMGIALPMVCAFAYVATKKRWSELLKLEIVAGLLVILVVALPWYVAMYVRHGAPFTDRLIFHDMFNRAFNHVHDTNEGDDTSFRFYIWQLGYALYPWTGLAPLGLAYWLRRSDKADDDKGDVSVFLVMWFVFAYSLFSFMGTKFHHYIFPAVPPVAMLIGIVLSDAMGDRPLAKPGKLPFYAAGIGGAVVLALFGLASLWAGSFFGSRDKADSVTGTDVGRAIGLGVVGLGLAALIVRRWRSDATDAAADVLTPDRRAHEGLMVGAAAVGGALLLALVGRDLVLKPEGADQPGAIRLLQLFTYNYRRSWPDSLDFTPAMAAFALLACALVLLLAVKAIRPHVASALVALALVWGVWGLDVYMVKTAPHWGQRELMEAYYKTRSAPEEPLVAYQMNWKGENFYTGNHVPAFVSTGSTFTTWLKKKKDEGAKVMFFVTEHSRVAGLKSEVGARQYTEVTDRVVCNKFVIVRAEL